MDMLAKGRHNGGAPIGNKNAVGNEGWKKGGITAEYVSSRLDTEVEIPEELCKVTTPTRTTKSVDNSLAALTQSDTI